MKKEIKVSLNDVTERDRLSKIEYDKWEAIIEKIIGDRDVSEINDVEYKIVQICCEEKDNIWQDSDELNEEKD